MSRGKNQFLMHRELLLACTQPAPPAVFNVNLAMGVQSFPYISLMTGPHRFSFGSGDWRVNADPGIHMV